MRSPNGGLTTGGSWKAAQSGRGLCGVRHTQLSHVPPHIGTAAVFTAAGIAQLFPRTIKGVGACSTCAMGRYALSQAGCRCPLVTQSGHYGVGAKCRKYSVAFLNIEGESIIVSMQLPRVAEK
jgi:hypothetical protein